MNEQLSLELPVSKISGEHIVTKSNTLIKARQSLTLQELRIIYMFISLISPDDQDFKPLRIQVKDIADFIGVQRKNYYNKVKEVVNNLSKKGVYIKKDKSELYINWVSSSEYFTGKGFVELEFSQKMKPYLLQLKKQFTQFKLKNVMKLNSEYSMRIYEILKQDQFRHEVVYTLSDLRDMLGLSENTYKQISHFKDRILNRAQQELKEQTDIKFTYKDLKQGRQIVGFKFNISKNSQIINQTIEDIEQSQDSIEVKQELFNILTSYGIRSKNSEEIVKKFDKDRITRNLKYTVSQQGKENMPGAIIDAIRKDYAKEQSFPHKEIEPKWMKGELKERENISEEEAKKRAEWLENYLSEI